jgi:uncharacterized protein (DUF1330 family)
VPQSLAGKLPLIGRLCAWRTDLRRLPWRRVNTAALAAYAKLAGPAIEAAGGRLLARGGLVKVHEAGVSERTVIIEFDSFELAVAAYDSNQYREALAALGDGAERDVRIGGKNIRVWP